MEVPGLKLWVRDSPRIRRLLNAICGFSWSTPKCLGGKRNLMARTAVMLGKMVSPADILVGAPTDQQAHASRVAPVAGPEGEAPIHADVVSLWTSGSLILIELTSSVGRASTYLAAVGQAVLGNQAFDDESVDGIREGRERR